MTTPPQAYGIDFTVPPGTPASAPVFQPFTMPGGAVTKVTLTVPTGHNGLTGFALFLAGTAIIPYGGDSWVIASGQEFIFNISREVQDGQLQVAGYNTGIYPHTFHVMAEWMPTLGVQGATAALAVSGTDTSATDQAVAGLQDFDTSDQEQLDTDVDQLDTSDLDEGESADTGELPAVAPLDTSEAPDLALADVSDAPAPAAPSEPVTALPLVPLPAPPKPAPKPKPKPAPKHAAPKRVTKPRKL